MSLQRIALATACVLMAFSTSNARKSLKDPTLRKLALHFYLYLSVDNHCDDADYPYPYNEGSECCDTELGVAAISDCPNSIACPLGGNKCIYAKYEIGNETFNGPLKHLGSKPKRRHMADSLSYTLLRPIRIW